MPVRVTATVLLLAATLVGSVSAQSESPIRVTAEAEPMGVRTDEIVVFTVRVRGASITTIRTPDPPSATNLSLQRRAPSTLRNLSFDGGAMGQTVTFTWRFRPRRVGTARIQPVTVTIRGEEYTTEGIRIRVRPTSRPPSARSHPRSRTSSPPSQEVEHSALDARDLFIRATATADRAYQNEQVVVEYRLFYRPGVRLRHSRLADAWDAPGFWREEFDVASRPIPRTQRAYGRSYETIVLKRVALFPTRPGTLRVDPLRIEAEAQGTLQMRGGTVRSRFEPVQLASEALSLPVRPLPPTPAPSFDGAVGTFGMAVRTRTDSATVGTAVPVTVRVRGTGNLATLAPPRLDVPSEFEVYEPAVQTNVDRGGQRIGGTKVFTYTLVPRAPGTYDLPPATFSYFNPETEQYETLRSTPPTLHVTGEVADRVVGRTGDGLPVGDVTELIGADEPRWVRTDRPPLYRQLWVYLALMLPVLGAAGGALYRRRSAEPAQGGDQGQALDTAQNRLDEARPHLRDGADSAAYDAVEQALLTFLGERIEGGRISASQSVLDRHLTRHGVPEELRTALYDLLDRCEEAQFAPDPSPRGTGEGVIDDAQRVLRRLDEALPAAERHDRRP